MGRGHRPRLQFSRMNARIRCAHPARRRCFTRAWRVVIGLGKIVVGDLAGFFHERRSDPKPWSSVTCSRPPGTRPPKRRLSRGLRLLSEQLSDLRPGEKPPGSIQVQTART